VTITSTPGRAVRRRPQLEDAEGKVEAAPVLVHGGPHHLAGDGAADHQKATGAYPSEHDLNNFTHVCR
jgi:hypothetical protein